MHLARKLREGRPVGGWCSFPSSGVAETLATQQFDFVTIDTEHAPTTTESVENLVRAVEAAPGDTEAIVRVASNDPVRIKRALDAGPVGIMAPQINSVEEARELVVSCRYPPQGDAATGSAGSAVDPDGLRGRRGIAASRATDYGKRIDEYVREVNEELAVIAQIETTRAVDAAADIASVSGVDALFVGPADLSAALGCFREYDDPGFTETIDRVLEAGAETDTPVGTLATSEERIDAWLDAGFDFLVTGTDAGFLAAGATSAVDRYRDRVGE